MPACRWYELAKRVGRLTNNYQDRLPALLGIELTKQRRSTLKRVAGMHPRIGHLMDDVGLPYRHVRYIAHGKTPVDQKERARQRIGEWVEKLESREVASPSFYRELLRALDEPAAPVVVRERPLAR